MLSSDCKLRVVLALAVLAISIAVLIAYAILEPDTFLNFPADVQLKPGRGN